MFFQSVAAKLYSAVASLISRVPRGSVPALPLTIFLAGVIGLLAGLGATAFTLLIEFVADNTVERFVGLAEYNSSYWLLVCVTPAVGLLLVSWWTRRFAPEAQGHGVPEVITAVARHDGVIRPRVSLVKIIASALCIGTGGSVGREGPIVQIGSSMGSVAGQWFKLSAPNIKVLVASGAAAGISATFNAPIAGVIFASEIILGSFAVECMTPIVISSVLANVVQKHVGEYELNAAFPHIYYRYVGSWAQLPSYLILGLCCGLAAVFFVKLLYWVEDQTALRFPNYKVRALVMGLLVGLAGLLYPMHPPSADVGAEGSHAVPPLFGVGYSVVEHALHLDRPDSDQQDTSIWDETTSDGSPPIDRGIYLNRSQMVSELIWLLPLVFLKPILTSITLGGGGSGGVFAPSLFLGATLGASFGLVCNLLVPGMSASPGVYAIVGMGAVVAGTTQGILSAILIVYELTNDYHIILPIMAAAGIASILAQTIDPESIYQKKLSRRGESIARGHDMHRVEHIMVRDVMITSFPTLRNTDNLIEIVQVARLHSHIESLPVMDEKGGLVGIIRPEDLHRILDTDTQPHLVNADDIALRTTTAVSPQNNLLEALREFGSRDIETLPVEKNDRGQRKLVGLLVRADVMRRYRVEMLKRR
ncbi:MAG: CBS domain-containing protein [Planctomycetaceae bacterium]|nr:CBS domain-containing protein [Planctomycetaceae bacterium]